MHFDLNGPVSKCQSISYKRREFIADALAAAAWCLAARTAKSS
jgi:hypothetical protein